MTPDETLDALSERRTIVRRDSDGGRILANTETAAQFIAGVRPLVRLWLENGEVFYSPGEMRRDAERRTWAEHFDVAFAVVDIDQARGAIDLHLNPLSLP